MAAYEFTGAQDTPYPWGMVHPGDIAYFTGRAPNGDWAEFAATPEPPTSDAAPVEPSASENEEPKQPNKAASSEDWKAYAAADGSFEAATGMHPDDATRKAIVDHYTGGDQE